MSARTTRYKTPVSTTKSSLSIPSAIIELLLKVFIVMTLQVFHTDAGFYHLLAFIGIEGFLKI